MSGVPLLTKRSHEPNPTVALIMSLPDTPLPSTGELQFPPDSPKTVSDSVNDGIHGKEVADHCAELSERESSVLNLNARRMEGELFLLAYSFHACSTA